ncbi:MAG: hypothetical protein GEU71_16935, partial [Actinobacteria bacterium]|nr:hypothetical protein [Actinomycetota bacterium]
MTRIKQLPYAAVGASAEVLRNATTTAERVRDDLTKRFTDFDLPRRFTEFVDTAAVEGRELVGRIPGAAHLVDAESAGGHSVADIPGVGTQVSSRLR